MISCQTTICKAVLYLLFVLLAYKPVLSQTPVDSLYPEVPVTIWEKAVVPAVFIVVGSAVSGSSLEKRWQNDIRTFTGEHYKVTIDEYTQYAPIAQLYIANFAGVEARNHWFDQSKYLFLSNLATALVVRSLKEVIDKPRPHGGSLSFPSGHTSVAFANASVLFHEYENTAPWLAWSGYGFALTTGAFRIANNEHWVSDVVASAGIAMLFTVIIYHYEPLKDFNPFLNRRNATAFRFQVGLQSDGLNLRIRF